MGRTLPTSTDLLRRETEEWKPFRNMLPKADRKEFDVMLQSAQLFRYAMMTSLPQHPVAFRPIMMSILFRHYIQLVDVRKAIEEQERGKDKARKSQPFSDGPQELGESASLLKFCEEGTDG